MAELMDASAITKTRHEVEIYFSLAQAYSRPWHDNIGRWRKWYSFQHYKEKALPYEERYPDPTPTNVVDLAVGILVKKPVEFKAQGWEPDVDEEEDSSRIEKYLNGTIYVNMEREEMNLPYEVVTNLVRDGAAVLYSVWDPVLQKTHLVESPDGGVLNETPIILQVIDPEQMFLLPGGPKRWGHVFRVWEMTVHDVEMTWDVKLNRYAHMNKEDRMTQLVKVKDYWRILQRKKGGKIETYVENALVAEDTVIRPIREMKGYDDQPYTLGFFKPVNRDDPNGWHGIIEPLITTIQHLEKSVNRRGRQIRIYTSLPFVARTIPNRKVRIDPALGNLVHLNPEEGLEFPTWPGNAPDVQMHINFLRARLQQAGFTDVMFGEGPSQISGYALSQLGDQNQIRLAQPVQHLELMWTSWARKVLALTSFFTQGRLGIRVYGQLKGQNFAQQLAMNDLEHYMVRAMVQPVFPNEEVRKHAMGTQTAGTLSLHTRMERYYDIEQPDDERKRILDDQTEQHPGYVQAKVLYNLLQWVQSDDPLRQAAAQMVVSQMMSGGGPSGPQGGGTGMGLEGRPKALPSPNQMEGVMSPTGQPTPQERGEEPAGQSFEDALATLTETVPGLTPPGGGI